MKELEAAIQLRESGNFEEARSLLLELLEQHPLNPSIWYQCAWIHDVLELESEAVAYYKKSLELGLKEEERQGAFLGLGSLCERTLISSITPTDTIAREGYRQQMAR
ncbi:tetratricopeptide repeat protein [Paenibacillus tyrfis]|uniref:tetratricopeptide repeat protein n=1 Tax=Paenibacillus tyrfis TaxID=1501230 RepID=UPI0015C5F334|nr:tetratricopeptide repeat protein [Paenibacillus tyrfis]